MTEVFSDMTSTFMTSVYFTWYLHLWHQFFRRKIDIYDISVFSDDILSMTSVYFTWYQMKTISSTDGWRRRRTHSIIGLWHFCSCIENDDNTTIGPFVLVSW